MHYWSLPVPAVAPSSKKQAEKVLDALERPAEEARGASERLKGFGSPYWSAAAELRIGDVFYCQATKMVAIHRTRMEAASRAAAGLA